MGVERVRRLGKDGSDPVALWGVLTNNNAVEQR
jgi:hypothetical protein